MAFPVLQFILFSGTQMSPVVVGFLCVHQTICCEVVPSLSALLREGALARDGIWVLA